MKLRKLIKWIHYAHHYRKLGQNIILTKGYSRITTMQHFAINWKERYNSYTKCRILYVVVVNILLLLNLKDTQYMHCTKVYMYYLIYYVYAEEATNLFHSIVRASSIVVPYKAKNPEDNSFYWKWIYTKTPSHWLKTSQNGELKQ